MLELNQITVEQNIDLVAITEILPKKINEPNQHEETKNRFHLPGFVYEENPKGRGVCFFIKNNIEFKRLRVLEHTFSPSIFCQFKSPNKEHFVLGVIYRSPNCNTKENEEVNELINLVSEKHPVSKENVIILGDFNYPEIDWSLEVCKKHKEHKASKFLVTIQRNFLKQHIEEPTHYRGRQTPTLIDLTLSNNPGIIQEISHLPPLGFSHHSVLIMSLNINSPMMQVSLTPKYLVEKGDFNKMRAFMEAIEWEITLKDKDVDQCWAIIENKLQSAKDMFVPIKRTIKPKLVKRSFTAPLSLLDDIRQKRQAFKYYKKYPTSENYDDYKRLRNLVKKQAKKTKQGIEKRVAAEAKTNPKAFFQYVTAKIKPPINIGNLEKEDGSLTENDKEKSEVLNKFFASVFTKEDPQNIPDFDMSINDTLYEISITKDDMYKALRSLKTNKSPGPDEIHPKILNELANQLAYPLKTLFDLTLKEGKIPQKWKEAEVIPIFKKGCKSKPGNYRPVSLTSIVCKTFEKFVKDALYKHFVNNNLLTDHQFGFCKGRSCVSQLLVTLNSWMSSLDSNKPVDALYLDFQKAFDTVPHKRLLTKLSGYGIRGQVLNWIKDFLCDRTQYVSVKGNKSDYTSVTSGVPQGSVLGPTLFIYYINDLPSVTNKEVHIFADDTKAYSEINSLEDKNQLQTCLNNLMGWSDKWLLRFNSDKCKVLHMGKNNPKHKYYINNDNQQHELTETICEKDLGVHIDSNLNFHEHISKTASKARTLAGMINRTISFKTPEIMIPLYKALVRSVAEYANPVWCPFKKKDIKCIEDIQRHFTRRVFGMRGLEYNQRLKKLKLPSLEFRRLRGDLLECYKILHNIYDPLTTNTLLTHSSLTTSTTTRSHDFKLVKGRVNGNKFQHFFTNRIINVWNRLPNEVVNAKTINSFKNLIDKTLNEYMYATNINITDIKVRNH